MTWINNFSKIYSLSLRTAPTAARIISDFLKDTKTTPNDYDAIVTGDLGFTGSKLIYENMDKGRICKVLFVATGAMMSQTSSKQGNTIPSIVQIFKTKRSDST